MTVTARSSAPTDPAPAAARRPPWRMAAVLVVTVVVVLSVAWAVIRTAPAQPAASAPVGRAMVGQLAPGFTAAGLDGSQVSLEALRGTAVWLTFGATWCADCRTEAPDLQDAALAARAAGVETVMVYSGDDRETVRAYAARLGLTMTQVPDPESRVAATYRIPGVPTHYFIDGSGMIRSVSVGVLSRAQMDAALAQLTR